MQRPAAFGVLSLLLSSLLLVETATRCTLADEDGCCGLACQQGTCAVLLRQVLTGVSAQSMDHVILKSAKFFMPADSAYDHNSQVTALLDNHLLIFSVACAGWQPC